MSASIPSNPTATPCRPARVESSPPGLWGLGLRSRLRHIGCGKLLRNRDLGTLSLPNPGIYFCSYHLVKRLVVTQVLCWQTSCRAYAPSPVGSLLRVPVSLVGNTPVSSS